MNKIRIGTRGSKLALAQTETVIAALKAEHGSSINIETVEIKTLGDSKQGTAKASQSDKRDWIKELEEAIVEGKIDLAVHSGKDIPAEIDPETTITPVMKRTAPHDVFIGKLKDDGTRLKYADLEQGAVVGTASLRRKALILRNREDLSIVDHRGNVPTRLNKLEKSEILSGIILAEAGLLRLGYNELESETLDDSWFCPAVHQGTLAVQFKSDRTDLENAVKLLTDTDTHLAWTAERSCVELLGADCKSAVGIYAKVEGNNTIELQALILSHSGKKTSSVSDSCEATLSSAAEMGKTTAEKLLKSGGKEILETSR